MRILSLLSLLSAATFLICGTASATVVLVFEDFENSGSARAGVQYTSNKNGTAIAPIRNRSAGDNSNDYYGRFSLAELNLNPGTDSRAGEPVEFTNVQGTDFFAVQDHNFDGSGGGALDITLTWSGIDVTGRSEIDFSWFAAEDNDGASEDWDSTDSFRIEYDLNDGNGFQQLWRVESELADNDGNGTADETNEAPRVDTNFDGTGDGVEITEDFTQFTAQLTSVVATTLDVRVVFDRLTNDDEDFAFDSFRITAVPEPGSVAFLMVLGSVAGFRRRRV